MALILDLLQRALRLPLTGIYPRCRDGRWETTTTLPRMHSKRRGCGAVVLAATDGGNENESNEIGSLVILGGQRGLTDTSTVSVEVWQLSPLGVLTDGDQPQTMAQPPLGTLGFVCLAVTLPNEAIAASPSSLHAGPPADGGRSECILLVGKHRAARYDPRLQMWTESSPSPYKVSGAAAVAIGHRLYLLGGHDGTTPLNQMSVFDSHVCRWEAGPSMAQCRFHFGAATISRHIYVVGGTNGIESLKSVERYDTTNQTWTAVPNMKVRRKGCVAAAGADGRLYVFGGQDGYRVLNSCERYDPITQQWKILPPMKKRRVLSAVAVWKDRIYVIGGFDGTLGLDSVEQYTVPTRYGEENGETPENGAATRRGLGGNHGMEGGVEVTTVMSEPEPHHVGEGSTSLYPLGEPPNELFCPITGDIMVDPVVATDGHSYEREAIMEWFSRFPQGKPARSPKTNVVLIDTRLLPNHNLRSLCRQHQE